MIAYAYSFFKHIISKIPENVFYSFFAYDPNLLIPIIFPPSKQKREGWLRAFLKEKKIFLFSAIGLHCIFF